MKLEEEVDRLCSALRRIEEIYVDGCDTHADWRAMGEIARSALEAVEPPEPPSNMSNPKNYFLKSYLAIHHHGGGVSAYVLRTGDQLSYQKAAQALEIDISPGSQESMQVKPLEEVVRYAHNPETNALNTTAGRTFAVDFDGTCVTHEYPAVGRSIGAEPVLRRIVAEGGKIILHTMRSGNELTAAEQWFAERDIPLHGVQFDPGQSRWTSSTKCYAHTYIDDAALGVPLKRGAGTSRPYVDWKAVEAMLWPYDPPAQAEPVDVAALVASDPLVARCLESGMSRDQMVQAYLERADHILDAYAKMTDPKDTQH